MINRSLLFSALLLLSILLVLPGCSRPASSDQQATDAPDKVGVLLVNHGSRSKRWRDMLLDVEQRVREPLLAQPGVIAVKTAFMEEQGPDIATQLRALDAAGCREIIVVPLFLTVSSHSLDDIPTIVGIKSDPQVLERLRQEKVELYRPQARVTLTPTLDFTSLLKKNVLRRVQTMTPDTHDTGVVLVAYGAARYNQQWEKLMGDIGGYLQAKAGIGTVAYAWCGHIVDYSPQPTAQAIRKVLELEDQVDVVPLLVAVDPDFQDDIIGEGVRTSGAGTRVHYRGDAILPDENLDHWIIDIVKQTLAPRS